MSKKFFSGWSTWQWLLVGVSTALGIFLLFRSSKKGAKVTIPQDAPQMLIFHLNNFLIGSGYDPAIIPFIIALSAMESGRWTSGLWDYANNPWGMKDPVQRQTTSIGSTPGVAGIPKGFAIYLGSSQAAQDFVLYLNARKSPKKFKRFYDFIAFVQSQGYEPDLSTMEYFTRCLNAIE